MSAPNTLVKSTPVPLFRLDAPDMTLDPKSLAQRSIADLISMKGEVEYGSTLITLAKAKPLVRRAMVLVEIAKGLARRP